MLLRFVPYQVSGPGLQSATANHPTHVIVEITDPSNRPCSVPQKVTAKLEHISKETPTSPSPKPLVICVAVTATSPFQYEVSYTPVSRGQYKLHVQLNDLEIKDSPFTVTVYPDPAQLQNPVRIVTGLKNPYGIAFNSHGKIIITQRNDNQSLISIEEEGIEEYGDNAEKMTLPKGIAIDGIDNVYVTSEHKLHKFSSSGEQIKCIGEVGRKGGEFNDPRGIALYNDQLYVCDRLNRRIQVFDLDLNFDRSIGSFGNGKGKFDTPKDVKFDTDGNMYVADFGNKMVQVLDFKGDFIRVLDEERVGGIYKPSGLCIINDYVYMSDYDTNSIVVYKTSGQFVTKFGGNGKNEGEFLHPRYITSCADGFIYVCDCDNNRVQIY